MLVVLLAVCRDDLRFPVTERAASPTSADLLLPLYKAAFIQICVRPGDRRYSECTVQRCRHEHVGIEFLRHFTSHNHTKPRTQKQAKTALWATAIDRLAHAA
jgi:hypothetical protein